MGIADFFIMKRFLYSLFVGVFVIIALNISTEFPENYGRKPLLNNWLRQHRRAAGPAAGKPHGKGFY